METSDSEYFESADEDFDSDNENEAKHCHSAHQNVSNKIIEPEICKLKISESGETHEKVSSPTTARSDGVVDEPFIKQESDGVRSVNPKIAAAEKKCESELSRPKDTHNVQADNMLLINSHKTSRTKTTTADFQEDTDEETNMTNSNNKPMKLVSEITVENSEKSNISETLAESENAQDLWNDDEFDWGSEAAKEVSSQKTESHTPDSKNEDSGWDDFNAEWESDSLNLNQVNPKDTIEAIKENKVSKKPETESPSSIKENMWEDDDEWEPIEKPSGKLEEQQKESESSWGTWGGWGVSSLLNTATQSVSTLTAHVSQGMSTVIESSIGIPEPEEMARINKLYNEKEDAQETVGQDPADDSSPITPIGFGLGNLVSGVSQLTKLVESTGTKVITGGLDTLEAIGKKTVEVLQEGDPGLRKKRAFLKLDGGKPNLSQILREAKERAEEANQDVSKKYIDVKRTKNYESLFDDHQGLVHLEALEMLSKLCNIKLGNLKNSLSGDSLKDMQETLDQVKELCELPEDEEDDKLSPEEASETISNAINEINIPISYSKFFAVNNETDKWLETVNLKFVDQDELHQQAIETLAQLTALAVEQFHKAGELLLVKEHRSTADEADSLVQITTTLKAVILRKSQQFTDKMNLIENADKEKISGHITNIFYEAANSVSYVQEAFQLLIPVLQVGAV